ncbi:hypothetical protein CDES_10305 [Corynebacterium deserti GIMN1.010]|uniref:Uncharacterized protein n=1 Tax=Corynebacterium deserti GIMN1.010 TaxID=931089 RepID=A0A0M4CKF8_9CORY|nr:hypothetical protein [Corynebacterium deserti]ALC06438.1 hypothetical protein CDES_10305 [Corynebacterium deserti GIMN1.010]
MEDAQRPKAGIFGRHAEETWVWLGNELFDESGKVIADVRSDVLYVAQERLLIESTPGTMRFRCRATLSGGQVYTMTQSSFSVRSLTALCGSRRYELKRVSPWRKERTITNNGVEVARVRPMTSGKVEFIVGTAGEDALPFVDAVFLSWACVLVDSSVRRPKI